MKLDGHMKFFTILIAIAFSHSICWSQSADLSPWFTGNVQLKSDHVIAGRIHFNPDMNIIVVDNHNRLKAYNAYQVKQFCIYDSASQLQRFFKSFQSSVHKRNKFDFFEVVVSGDIKLLRQEKKYLIPSQDFHYFFSGDFETFGYKKYFSYYLLKDEQWVKVKNFKKQIQKLTKDYSEVISEYIEQKDLKLLSLKSQVHLISYYNHLKTRESELVTFNNLK